MLFRLSDLIHQSFERRGDREGEERSAQMTFELDENRCSSC